MHPPSGAGGTSAALQDAVVWTMFHYGIAGWSKKAVAVAMDSCFEILRLRQLK